MSHLLCACHCYVPDSLTMKHFLRRKIGERNQLESCDVNHLHGVGCNRPNGVVLALLNRCQSDTHTSFGRYSTTSVLNGIQSECHLTCIYGTDISAVRGICGLKLDISEYFAEVGDKLVIVSQNSYIVGGGTITVGIVRIYNGTLEDFVLLRILTKLLSYLHQVSQLTFAVQFYHWMMEESFEGIEFTSTFCLINEHLSILN